MTTTSKPNLTVVPIVPAEAPKPDDYVILALDSVMERALAGEIASVCVVAVNQEGAIVSSYAADRMPELIGAMQIVNTRLLRHYQEE